MPSAHALLSPSASKRWMTCAPSARLESAEPDKGSSYAREGTLAHAMAEALLTSALQAGWDAWPDNADSLAGFVGPELRQAEAEGYDAQDMLRTVSDKYCSIVWADYLTAKEWDPEAVLLVEATLKLDDFIPEGFGSSDAVIIYGRNLRVYDLKYGQGVKVDADHNTQMMCYAVGAMHGPGELYPVMYVAMTIIQPRLSHVSTWGLPADLLESWAVTELAPKARKAYQGEGARMPGDHCKFCRVAARCRALATFAQVTKEQASDPSLLTPDELSDLLHRLGTLRTFISSVEDYAMGKAMQGDPVPGWKLVEGRSSRVVTDPGQLAYVLNVEGYKDEDIMKPAELRTLTDLERIVGKKVFAALAEPYITRKAGKPTLVPADDPRPAYSPAESAAQDFADLS